MKYEYFIPYNVPSSKNNRIFVRGKDNDGTLNTQKDRLKPSAATQRWVAATQGYFLKSKVEFRNTIKQLQPPYYIEFVFVRKTKQKFDYHNMVQVVADCMQHAQWIPDDDMDNFKCYFGDYSVDSVSPGVQINILPEKPKHHLPVKKILCDMIELREAILHKLPDSVDRLKKIYQTIKDSQ